MRALCLSLLLVACASEPAVCDSCAELRQKAEAREAELVADLSSAWEHYEQAVLAAVPPQPVERFLFLRDQSEGTFHWVLMPTADPAAQGMASEVIWAPARREGYLRAEGLGDLSAEGLVYQIFLIDGPRAEDAPIPAGSFQGGQEVFVPLTPAVPPLAIEGVFLTLEKRGGRVVSLQDRLIAEASGPGSH